MTTQSTSPRGNVGCFGRLIQFSLIAFVALLALSFISGLLNPSGRKQISSTDAWSTRVASSKMATPIADAQSEPATPTGEPVTSIVLLPIVARSAPQSADPLPTPAMPTVAPVVQPVVTQPIVPTDGTALSFEEICDTNSTHTDLQQEDIARAMAGKTVIGWTGKVYDVVSSGSLYKVLVDMRDDFFNSRQVEILDVGRPTAERLNVDQVITFDGTIQGVDMFVGGICNPISIMGATIR